MNSKHVGGTGVAVDVQLVYFIQSKTTGLVKIGRTNTLKRRVQELTREHGELEVLYILQRDVVTSTIHRLEQALHYWHRKHHVHGEWFTPDVIDTMRTLDLSAVRKAYKDSELVEIRLPKALAKLDIERVLERHVSDS